MNSDECVLYQDVLLKNADEIQKHVLRFFDAATKDISTVFARTESGNYVVSMRSQFVVLFTYLDICASFWDLYEDVKTRSVGERFRKWVSKFCFVKENKFYVSAVYGKMNGEHLYGLRCSLVHFFGISLKREHYIKDKVSVALVPDDEARERLKLSIQKRRNKGHSIVTLNPREFADLLVEGKNLMIKSWLAGLESKSDDRHKLLTHIKGMKRISDHIKIDGAELVYYE